MRTPDDPAAPTATRPHAWPGSARDSVSAGLAAVGRMNRIGPMAAWRRLPACAIAASIAAMLGCSQPPVPKVRPADLPPDPSLLRPALTSQEARERALTQQWVGRPIADLIQAWGKPVATLEIPGRQFRTSQLLVFTGRDAAGGCIDAFVVVANGDRTIVAYVCR